LHFPVRPALGVRAPIHAGSAFSDHLLFVRGVACPCRIACRLNACRGLIVARARSLSSLPVLWGRARLAPNLGPRR